MSITKNLAKHLRDVYWGGNWTTSNFKEVLADVSWQQAGTQIYSLNTIATLLYHTNYYVSEVSKFLQGEPLNSKDEYSFHHPPIESQEDWDALLNKTWTDAEIFAHLIEQLPDSKMWEVFVDERYGNYYRNLQGIIEHLHYHLGQIVVIKKILLEREKGS